MLKGSMPALITPFKDGAVDLDTLKNWSIGTLTKEAMDWFPSVQQAKARP